MIGRATEKEDRCDRITTIRHISTQTSAVLLWEDFGAATVKYCFFKYNKMRRLLGVFSYIFDLGLSFGKLL